jgi:hypothetical protein
MLWRTVMTASSRIAMVMNSATVYMEYLLVSTGCDHKRTK